MAEPKSSPIAERLVQHRGWMLTVVNGRKRDGAGCPQCATTAMVRRVSALVWEGHSQLSMYGTRGRRRVGRGGWPAVGGSAYRGIQVSSLAQALSPPPFPPSRTAWWVWITILAAYCVSWVAIGIGLWNAPSRPSDMSAVDVLVGVGAGVCVVPALATVLLVALLNRRRRTDRQWRQAMPAMAEVWQAAWFCGRCGGAFLDAATAPAELTADWLRHRIFATSCSWPDWPPTGGLAAPAPSDAPCADPSESWGHERPAPRLRHRHPQPAGDDRTRPEELD